MSIIKIKQPVEYSFLQWINNFPESGHWADKERFYKFTKTVCRYNAKKWKNTEYLKSRILNEKPEFDQKIMDVLLYLYEEFIKFNKSVCYSTTQFSDQKVKKGYYIEIQVKHGNIYEVEKPIELI